MRLTLKLFRAVLRSLRNGPMSAPTKWMHELDIMEINGVKAEIEAAYKHFGYGAFVRDLARRLEEDQYI